MPNTTPALAIPYPLPTDGVRDYPTTGQALAQRLETLLTAMVPPGVIWEYAGAAAPAGWLLCNGATYPRSGATAALFNAIGTYYGAGDGSTTFAVPNKQDRVGVGVSASKPRGSTGGADTVTLAVGHVPPHTHAAGTLATNNAGSHSHDTPRRGAAGTAGGHAMGAGTTQADGTTQPGGSHSHDVTGSTASGPGTTTTPVPIMPPWVATNFIIKT